MHGVHKAYFCERKKEKRDNKILRKRFIVLSHFVNYRGTTINLDTLDFQLSHKEFIAL